MTKEEKQQISGRSTITSHHKGGHIDADIRHGRYILRTEEAKKPEHLPGSIIELGKMYVVSHNAMDYIKVDWKGNEAQLVKMLTEQPGEALEAIVQSREGEFLRRVLSDISVRGLCFPDKQALEYIASLGYTRPTQRDLRTMIGKVPAMEVIKIDVREKTSEPYHVDKSPILAHLGHISAKDLALVTPDPDRTIMYGEV